MNLTNVTEKILQISFETTWANLARDSGAVLPFPGGRCYAIHYSA